MNGRANSGARNLLKTVSQTVGEKAHALVNPARAYPEVKVQSGIEACQERAIARAILHEAVHSIRLVVPCETAQRRPELLPLIAPDIKHAISRRRQEPFVRARKISVATNVLQVHWNLSESRSQNKRRNQCLASPLESVREPVLRQQGRGSRAGVRAPSGVLPEGPLRWMK